MYTWRGTIAAPRCGLILCSCRTARASGGQSWARWSNWSPSMQTCYERHGMTSSPVDVGQALAQGVRVTNDTLIVDLADGRTLSVPVSWYPRLAHGTSAEQAECQLIGRCHGIHWPKIDEDI